ncbi:hypothetical protein BC834DRAFT_258495 [Gloeopeniophorella convolvens]|nr:hypothetical protein BC834DRAFT_258495 [Gloeopeniophorella convolvens]
MIHTLGNDLMRRPRACNAVVELEKTKQKQNVFKNRIFPSQARSFWPVALQQSSGGGQTGARSLSIHHALASSLRALLCGFALQFVVSYMSVVYQSSANRDDGAVHMSLRGDVCDGGERAAQWLRLSATQAQVQIVQRRTKWRSPRQLCPLPAGGGRVRCRGQLVMHDDSRSGRDMRPAVIGRVEAQWHCLRSFHARTGACEWCQGGGAGAVQLLRLQRARGKGPNRGNLVHGRRVDQRAASHCEIAEPYLSSRGENPQWVQKDMTDPEWERQRT